MINSSIHTVELYKRVCYSDQLALSRTMKRLGVPSYSKGHGFVYVLEGRESTGITSMGLFSHYSKALGYNVDFHLEIALNPMRAVCDKGRKPVSISPEEWQAAYSDYCTRKINKVRMANQLGISRTTLDKLLKKV